MHSNLKIRFATIEDAPAIVEARADAILKVNTSYYDQLLLEEWVGPEEELIQKLMSNAADVRVVAEVSGEIVGYGELVTSQNLLGACYVKNSEGGKGFGGAIVAELERIAREKGLIYLHLNSSANAESFYVHCGYQVVERGKYTLGSGAVMNCVMMRKDL